MEVRELGGVPWSKHRDRSQHLTRRGFCSHSPEPTLRQLRKHRCGCILLFDPSYCSGFPNGSHLLRCVHHESDQEGLPFLKTEELTVAAWGCVNDRPEAEAHRIE